MSTVSATPARGKVNRALTKLESGALAAANRRIRVFPVEAFCKKPPLIKDWPTLASRDHNQIITWALMFPGCNWAAATGADSNVFVVDFDGQDGRDSRLKLEQSHGPFPKTLSSQTGRSDGGMHFYFRCGEELRHLGNSQGRIAPGVDIRANKGYAMLPPSNHPDGATYSWIDSEAEIAQAQPSFICALLLMSPASKANSDEDPVVRGRRNTTLTSIGGTWIRKGWEHAAICDGLLKENQRLSPTDPLPKAEVIGIARSLEKYRLSKGIHPHTQISSFINEALKLNGLAYFTRKTYLSPLFTFARLLKGRPEFAGMDGFQAAFELEANLSGIWPLLTELTEDPRAQFIADWDAARTIAGSGDVLNKAWELAQFSAVEPEKSYSPKYASFISFVAALQHLVGVGLPIGLGQERIAAFIGCKHQMVGNYIEFAVRTGLLTKTSDYVPRRRSAEFVYTGPNPHGRAMHVIHKS